MEFLLWVFIYIPLIGGILAALIVPRILGNDDTSVSTASDMESVAEDLETEKADEKEERIDKGELITNFVLLREAIKAEEESYRINYAKCSCCPNCKQFWDRNECGDYIDSYICEITQETLDPGQLGKPFRCIDYAGR